MHERRNYYRILQAQPDAPTEVIRSNYRTLLQKLRMHPDLGGSDEAAASLNLAYQTLRHPERRAEYDRELLARYSVQVLAQGGTGALPSSDASPQGNRRNHYRMLQVQPDASALIIDASYRALRARADDQEAALLDAAYEVLGDPQRRSAYDAGPTTTDAAEQAQGALAVAPASRPDGVQPGIGADAPGDYQPLITAYCAFCMTPHSHDLGASGHDAECAECASPLSPPDARDAPDQGRDAIRLVHEQEVRVRLYWLGPVVQAQLRDWSPHGALLECEAPLSVDDVIRLEGDTFTAVARVVHRQHQEVDLARVGLKFLATRFESSEGNFVHALA